MATISEASVSQIKGNDKQLERMQKARQTQLEKKMATERGMPAQLKAKEGQPEPIWGFGSNKDKFKSGFGAEGSNIVVKSAKDNSNA